MLDAMTALSLAGTIVQFVEFSSDIISNAKELNIAGTTQEIQRLETLTNDLLNINKTLEKGIQLTDSDDGSLQDLCLECNILGKDLIRRLNRLKVYEGDADWKIVKKAAVAIWSRRELEALFCQLSSFRSQIQLHVLVSFRKQFDLTALSQNSTLDGYSQRIISALRDHRDIFSETVERQIGYITNLRQDLVKLASNEHETTRSVILEAFNRKGSASSSESKSRRPSKNEEIAQSPEEERHIRELAEDRILQSLSFPSITARYSQVAKAHAKTFEWVLKSPQNGDQPSANFKEWLQFGDGIYWINGKAGSGKSTLMRYLCDHPSTRMLLESWSKPLPLNLASFFFWNSGTHDQKSQLGLLRGLLHDLLSRHRSLIPRVLPEYWRDEYLFPTEYYQEFHWDLQNMRNAFNTLSEQKDIRICLFVDGLDEYENDRNGTYVEIVSFFAEIAASPNLKICLSSRPLLVFEDAFRQGPSLKLQDLTSGDIRFYVNDKLNSHPRMLKLRKTNCHNADNLVDEIVSKASGVFLWVRLVVKSLLDGLTNRDRILDLQKRLEVLPADLGDLYKHMLFRQIDPLYHEQSSRIFQTFRAAKDGIPGASEGVDLLTMTFADEEDQELAMTSDINGVPRGLLFSKCTDMGDRLKSRCGGLLEVSETSQDPRELKVDFLHRTVRDFLEMPAVMELRLALPGMVFDPNECLMKSYLLQLKTFPLLHDINRDEFKEPLRLASLALDFARKSRDLTRNANIGILDSLDQTIQILWASKPRQTFDKNSHAIDIRYKHCWACYAGRKHKANEDFLSIAVSYGLKEYVEAKLKKRGPTFRKSHGSLLHHTVNATRPPEPDLLSLLLQNGEDTNRPLDGQSMWQATLGMLAKPATLSIISSDSSLKRAWIETCSLLLKGGADCNAIGLVHIEHDYSELVSGFENHQFQVRAFTPLYLFSRYGPYSSPNMEALLVSCGAVSVSVEAGSFDCKEALRLALNAALVNVSKLLLAESAKTKQPVKKIDRWRRKWMNLIRQDLQFLKLRG